MSATAVAWTVLRLAAASLLVAYLAISLPIDLRGPAALAALAVAPIYLLAHALRAVRLFLILYDGDLRLREALIAHVHSAGVSALIPFKLGEIYRVLVLCSVTGRLARSVMAAWIERVFDALLVMLLLAALAAFAGPAALTGAGWFLPVAAGFLFASFFVFLVLPENLGLIKRHLILKHNNAPALRLLALVDRLHRVLADAGAIWRSRFATVLWLSVGIWVLECGAVLAVLGVLGRGEAGLAAAWAGIFTEVTLRSSPWSSGAEGTSAVLLAAYRLGTIDVLALVALAFAPLWRSARAGAARPAIAKGVRWA